MRGNNLELIERRRTPGAGWRLGASLAEAFGRSTDGCRTWGSSVPTEGTGCRGADAGGGKHGLSENWKKGGRIRAGRAGPGSPHGPGMHVGGPPL